ncbi:MAG: radical SAM protein [Chloroflexi bacterium]|nr:radical SAM protein [Chloroflexota bacterium]
MQGTTAWEPNYLRLHRQGELRWRATEAWQRLRRCTLCPRACGADRLVGATGAGAACRTGARAVVASFHPHFGEEAPLVGSGGSGTIFFSHCNLACITCQNYEISQGGEGTAVEADGLAAMMLQLQSAGCHNINLVSPSHVVPQVLAGLLLAAEAGLRLPVVYNSGGYDAPPTLALLDGVVDIYMPDMKYADSAVGLQLSHVADYPRRNQAAVQEMHRQVGDLVCDDQGVARRGLLVRHLVLPKGLAGTAEVLRFLANQVSPNTYVNIMGQYRPCHQARETAPLHRPVTRQEMDEATRLASEAGLRRLDGAPGSER